MKRIGIELGIYADSISLFKAAKIAQGEKIDFFVPETHPKKFGVDAFDTLLHTSNTIKNSTVGTAVVNVFSRDKKSMLEHGNKLHDVYGNRFLFGIGTSAPFVVEQLYGKKFEKPVKRMIEYTNYLRQHGYPGKIFWGAVGDKMIKLSTKYANGVIFFMRTKNELKRAVKLVRNYSKRSNDISSFQVASIIPVSVSNSPLQARESAKATIAKYIGANEFYSNPLRMAGFDEQVDKIRKSYFDRGLTSAIKEVTNIMADDLVIQGNPKECAKQILEISQEDEVLDITIAGFDLPKSGFDDAFFENISVMLEEVQKRSG